MNDQDLLRQLDDRAARAASELRVGAAARPRPPFDPDRPVPLLAPAARPARVGAPRRVLAIAAVVALLAGLAGWWATASDEETGSATTTGEGLRPHVATDLPEGFVPFGVFDGSEAEAGGPARPTAAVFYGPTEDDPQLAIASGEKLIEGDDGLGDPVDLGGGRVARPLDELFGLPGVLVTGPSAPVVLLSRSLSIGALGEIAAAVRFDDGRAEVSPDELPDGWRRLTQEPDLVSAAFPMSAARTGGEQYGIDYVGTTPAGDAEGFDEMLVVVAVPGDDARRATARLLLDDVEEVVVQGRPALVGRNPTPQYGTDVASWTVAWSAEPGTLVRVFSYGLDRATTLRVAEGVRAADRDEWEELARQIELQDLEDRSGGESGLEIGRGSFPDGIEWVLRTADGGVGTDLAVADGSVGGNTASTGDPGAVAFRSLETSDRGDRHYGSGLLADEVVAVELRRADGSVIGRAEIVAGSDERGWVAELTADPVVVVAIAADGREIDRRTVEAGVGNISPGDGIDGSSGITTPVDPDGPLGPDGAGGGGEAGRTGGG